MKLSIDAILVPQGAEYQAVCRGLKNIKTSTPKVFAIPIGSASLTKYLENWHQNHSESTVLIMGLCGSLKSKHKVGDLVLYTDCIYSDQHDNLLHRFCDRQLTEQLADQLKQKVSLVKAVTSDRLIYNAEEKNNISKIYNAEVVDMEGFAALEFFAELGVAVAMLRVISDDSQYNIADITSALNTDGSLNPLLLTIEMLRQPIAALRLIRGSLQGLKVLKEVTKQLFLDPI